MAPLFYSNLDASCNDNQKEGGDIDISLTSIESEVRSEESDIDITASEMQDTSVPHEGILCTNEREVSRRRLKTLTSSEEPDTSLANMLQISVPQKNMDQKPHGHMLFLPIGNKMYIERSKFFHHLNISKGEDMPIIKVSFHKKKLSSRVQDRPMHRHEARHDSASSQEGSVSHAESVHTKKQKVPINGINQSPQETVKNRSENVLKVLNREKLEVLELFGIYKRKSALYDIRELQDSVRSVEVYIQTNTNPPPTPGATSLPPATSQQEASVPTSTIPIFTASPQPPSLPPPPPPPPLFPCVNRTPLQKLMHFEAFRLCTYQYSRFPPNYNAWVTQLAQDGFYCVEENGTLQCFACHRRYENNVGGIPLQDAHDQGCRRNERNVPLSDGTEGLTPEDLMIYHHVYGSFSPWDNGYFSGSYSGDRARETSTQSAYLSFGSDAFSRGNEGAALTEMAMAETDFMKFQDSRQYSSEPEKGSSGLGHVFDAPRSLPANPNTVSGTIVSEETAPGVSAESRQILTSFSNQGPASLRTTAPQIDPNATSREGTEEGAVGEMELPMLNLGRASYPQFASSHARRSTFRDWSPDHPQKPADLVAGGFFYAGYADCVRCFYCGLGLKYWRPRDDPSYQHARFRPHCLYNRMFKGQDYVDNVQRMLTGGFPNTSADYMPPQTGASASATPPAATPAAAAAPAATPASAQSSQYEIHMTSPAALEALRAGWSHQRVNEAVIQLVNSLGEECLVYDILLDVLNNIENTAVPPPDSMTVTNNIDVNSTQSSEDNEAEVETSGAKLSSVRASEPREVADSSATDEKEAGEAGAQAAGASVLSETPSVQDELMLVEREHAYLESRTTCMICHARKVSAVYLPCGHVIACVECADAATHCALCKKRIIGTANIFLS